MSSDGRVTLAVRGLRLHPATVVWMWGVLLLVGLSLHRVEFYISVLAEVVVAFFLARTTLLRMLRRSRWLLLSIVLLFGWMTPGMPVLGIWGLTDTGLSQAILHVGRLVFVLAWVALLLDRLEFPLLLSGFRGLLQPLEWVGVKIDQAVLRLALTMEKIKSNEPWCFDQMIQMSETRIEQGAMSIRLVVPDLTLTDACLIASSGLLLVMVMSPALS